LLYWPVSLLLIKTVQKEAKALNVVCHQATHRSGTTYMRYVQPLSAHSTLLKTKVKMQNNKFNLKM